MAYCIFLDNLTASELLAPTFPKFISVPSSKPMKMERIESSETSALKAQKPGDRPPPQKRNTIFITRRKFEIKINLHVPVF